MGQVQSEKTRSKQQCELETQCGSHTHDLSGNESEKKRKLRKNLREVEGQYDQGLTDLHLSIKIYKPSKLLMFVAGKRVPSFYVLPVSFWRLVEVLPCLCT